MPPAYVKPYVKRQKNDAADAEAICEAVTMANMRFVATKTPEQQSGLMLHRTRHLFIRQQTSVINAIRAHLAEFGIIAPVGRKGVEELLDVVADASDQRVPELARGCLAALGAQLRILKAQVLEFDRRITAWHRSNEMSMRLDEIFAFRAGHGGDPCAGQNRPALTAPATPGQASHGRKAEAGVPRLTLIWRLLKSDAALTCNTCLFKRIHFVISQRELVRWLLVACLRRHRPDEHDRRYQLGGISAAPTSR